MVVGFTTTYAISAYHHLSCEFEFRWWRGVLDTTLCDKVCQWLATGRWFSPNNNTDCHDITETVLLKVALNTITLTDFPKLAEKLSVIRTDRHENLVSPKNILPVRKKSPKKFTVTCIMFSLAFLEWFTLVLAIGHLISPLVLIEVKVIQFSVFSVVQNCICYVFYSVCL
jgi:hypothetical protein